MKYFLITLGCQMNLSDSERLTTVFENEMGMVRAESEDDAQIVGIIACSVRQKAIDKVYSRISKWNKQKSKRSLITFLTGCILPKDKESFLKLFDFVFEMSELQSVPELIAQYGIVTPASIVHDPTINNFWNIKPQYQSNFDAFVPIQNGCDKFCTFCAVPYTRGREVSRPSHEIVEEVKQLVDKGYKSITLLGQNVNSYGLDKGSDEISFPGLLEKIGEYGLSSGKEFWVYFTSPHPRDMTTDVIDVMAKYKVLAKQLHLPLQSGDDKVLIRMNRKHGLSQYRTIVHYIREKLPEATLFTDIIVGFTGESDDHFENSRKAMYEFQFNMAYIAQYSKRPGAASSRWEDDISKEIKGERFHKLTEDLKEVSLKLNKNMIGSSFKVLVRGKDRKDGYLSALTEGKIIIRFPSTEDLIGQFVNVKVESASFFSLEGSMLDVEN